MSHPDRAGMLGALQRLVEAESPSTDKARCDRCADAVAEVFLAVTGVSSRRHPQEERGDHLELRFGEGAEPVLVLCHYDTVWEAGTLQRMPFQVQGDRVT